MRGTMTSTIHIDVLQERMALAMHQLKWLPLRLKQELKKLQLWEDVVQTCALAAVEATRAALSVRETSNLAQRHLHALLRDYGFHKPRNGGRRCYIRADFDTPISAVKKKEE